VSVALRIEKPPYGTPCNGCGLCCQNEICPLGEIVFPRAQAPCPALVVDGDRYACGLITTPQTFRPLKASIYGVEELRAAAVIGVGAGIGCDAQLLGELEPPADFVRELSRVTKESTRSRARKIEKLWGSR